MSNLQPDAPFGTSFKGQVLNELQDKIRDFLTVEFLTEEGLLAAIMDSVSTAMDELLEFHS